MSKTHAPFKRMTSRSIGVLGTVAVVFALGGGGCQAWQTPSVDTPDGGGSAGTDGAQATTGGAGGGAGPGTGGSNRGTGGAPGDGSAPTADATTDTRAGDGGGVAVADAGGTGGAAGVTGPGTVSLFDGTTLSGWLPSSGTGVGNAPGSWNVQDSALHCAGLVRGTLISKNDHGNFRLIFDVRQLPSTGTDNHYASVLIWGARPPPNDAIGGIQFGNPNGYSWDYRPGHNNNGAGLFKATSGGYSRTAWARCEILANVATGVARMACCSLGTAVSCKATEVLRFTDPTAGRIGPIALQAHSVGGHDEYKNITIEDNPTVNDLVTTK